MSKLAVLLTCVVALVSVTAGCGGDETSSEGTTATTETESVETTGTVETDTTGTVETDTTGTVETDTTGTTTETTGATTDEEGTGNAANGESVFASAGCGGCHTLAAAGSSGSIGPNLDDASPSFDKVIERVTQGKGAMPSFADRLSDQEIRDVAAFVSSSTRD